MRTLRRNKIRIYYANYRDKVPLKDEYGNFTGEYEIVYDNPIAIMANVSAAGGVAVTQYFGTQENYDKVIILDFKDADIVPPGGSQCTIEVSDDGNGNVSITSDDIELVDDGTGNVAISLSHNASSPNAKSPITESSVMWIDSLPVMAEDGSTQTPHDYIVKRVAPSLNSVSIAVSKVNVNA